MKQPNLWPPRARSERGAGKTEYLIIVSLIAIFTIGAVAAFGDNIRALFSTSDNALAGLEDVTAPTKPADVPSHYSLKGALSGKDATGSGSGTPGSGVPGSVGAPGSSTTGSGSPGGLASKPSALGSGPSTGGPSTGGISAGGISAGGVSTGGPSAGGPSTGGIKFDVFGKGGKSTRQDNLKKAWGDDNQPASPSPSPAPPKKLLGEVGVGIASKQSKSEALKVGGSNANMRLGTYDRDASLQAKYDRNKGEGSVTGSAGVRVTGVELNAKGTIGDEKTGGYGKGSAQVRVKSVSARIDGSVAVSKKGVSAKVGAGAEVNLLEGAISAEGGFRIPRWVPVLGGAKVYAGGQASGQVGASAKAHGSASAGKTGVEFGGGFKVALGAGGGFNIKVGVSFD